MKILHLLILLITFNLVAKSQDAKHVLYLKEIHDFYKDVISIQQTDFKSSFFADKKILIGHNILRTDSTIDHVIRQTRSDNPTDKEIVQKWVEAKLNRRINVNDSFLGYIRLSDQYYGTNEYPIFVEFISAYKKLKNVEFYNDKKIIDNESILDAIDENIENIKDAFEEIKSAEKKARERLQRSANIDNFFTVLNSSIDGKQRQLTTVPGGDLLEWDGDFEYYKTIEWKSGKTTILFKENEFPIPSRVEKVSSTQYANYWMKLYDAYNELKERYLEKYNFEQAKKNSFKAKYNNTVELLKKIDDQSYYREFTVDFDNYTPVLLDDDALINRLINVEIRYKISQIKKYVDAKDFINILESDSIVYYDQKYSISMLLYASEYCYLSYYMPNNTHPISSTYQFYEIAQKIEDFYKTRPKNNSYLDKLIKYIKGYNVEFSKVKDTPLEQLYASYLEDSLLHDDVEGMYYLATRKRINNYFELTDFFNSKFSYDVDFTNPDKLDNWTYISALLPLTSLRNVKFNYAYIQHLQEIDCNYFANLSIYRITVVGDGEVIPEELISCLSKVKNLHRLNLIGFSKVPNVRGLSFDVNKNENKLY